MIKWYWHRDTAYLYIPSARFDLLAIALLLWSVCDFVERFKPWLWGIDFWLCICIFCVFFFHHQRQKLVLWKLWQILKTLSTGEIFHSIINICNVHALALEVAIWINAALRCLFTPLQYVYFSYWSIVSAGPWLITKHTAAHQTYITHTIRWLEAGSTVNRWFMHIHDICVAFA